MGGEVQKGFQVTKTAITSEGPKLQSQLDEGGKFFDKTPHPDVENPELHQLVQELAKKTAERYAEKEKESVG